MTKIDDGGPAFPVPSANESGLSKLDWFAGQALLAIAGEENLLEEEIAEYAYNIAEAMLAERRNR